MKKLQTLCLPLMALTISMGIHSYVQGEGIPLSSGDAVIASNAKLQQFTNLGPLTAAQVEVANRPLPMISSSVENTSTTMKVDTKGAEKKQKEERKLALSKMTKEERKAFLQKEKEEAKLERDRRKAETAQRKAAEKAEKQRKKESSKATGKDVVSTPVVSAPNPIQEYSNLGDAFKAIQFIPPMPTIFPENYDIANVSTISGKTLQILLAPHDSATVEDALSQAMAYRVQRGSGDISGVYDTFNTVDTQEVDGRQVVFKGNDGRVSLATWEYEGNTFSLYFSQPVGIDQAHLVVHGTTVNQEDIQNNFSIA